MRTSSELLLTFLLNAVWQIALLALLASFGAWLLRQSAARFQHWLWVAALCLSLVVPAVTAMRSWPNVVATPGEITYERRLDNPILVPPSSFERTPATTSNS